MFCTLISRLKILFICFLERNLSVVTFGCCPSVSDVFLYVRFFTRYICYLNYRGHFQLLMKKMSLTVAVSLFFLFFVVDGSIAVLCFLNGIAV